MWRTRYLSPCLVDGKYLQFVIILPVVAAKRSHRAHAAAVNTEGQVAVFGRTHGFKNSIRLAHYHSLMPSLVSFINRIGGGKSVEYFEPVFVMLEEKAVKVSCSAALTAILTECGKVYCFGSNNYGQCGFASEAMHAWNPTRVLGLEDEQVVDIAAGYQHVLACTEKGNVYAWGKGERGQLGLGTPMNMKSAERIAFPNHQKVVSVGAGFNQSFALTQDGELYGWGKLLALKEKNKDQAAPRSIARDVVLMCSSQFHTMFRTAQDHLYLVGRQKNYTKVKHDRHEHVQARMLVEPWRVSLDHLNVRDIHSFGRGIDNTHLISHSGEVYHWSWTEGDVRDPLQQIKVKAYETGFQSHVLIDRR